MCAGLSLVVMSSSVYNRQLLVDLFCVAQFGRAVDCSGLLRWHRVVQLGRYNRSQTRGQDQSGFVIWWAESLEKLEHIRSIPSFNLWFLLSVLWEGWMELECVIDLSITVIGSSRLTIENIIERKNWTQHELNASTETKSAWRNKLY